MRNVSNLAAFVFHVPCADLCSVPVRVGQDKKSLHNFVADQVTASGKQKIHTHMATCRKGFS